MPRRSNTEADSKTQLIRIIRRLTDFRISDHNLQRLLTAVTWARLHHSEISFRRATPKDAERQLKAMLELDDNALAKAIDDCDAGTRGAISAAQNTMHLDPDTKWIACREADCIPGLEILAPESIRHSVSNALANVKMQKAKIGPKEKPYQIDLAKTCLAICGHCTSF